MTGNNSGWRSFIKGSVKEFTKLVHYWLDKANISVLVIKYEDMLTDFATQLRKMLDFLQVSYSDKDIDCVVSSKLDNFHRNRASYDHYTPSDRQFVWNSLTSIETLLNKYNLSYKDPLLSKL